MKKDNRIIIDLSKCQYARFYYKDQHSNVRNKKPAFTVHGNDRDPDEMMYNSPESVGSYARRMGLIGIWTPEVRFQLTANHSVTYTGDKAISMYNAWKERIFNK